MVVVFVFDYLFGGGDVWFVQFGVGDGVQQQVQDLLLGGGRCFDDEGGVVFVGVGVLLFVEGLYVGFQVGFVVVVQVVEEQVFEQVWQLFFMV